MAGSRTAVLFHASEYLFSAPRGLHFFILTNQRDSASGLQDSGIFPASGYLFSAPRGLKKSIISTRFCSLSQVISSTCAGGQNIGGFRKIAIDIKNNVIRQYPTKNDVIRHNMSRVKMSNGNSLTHFLSAIYMFPCPRNVYNKERCITG